MTVDVLKFRDHRFQINAALHAIRHKTGLEADLNDYGDDRALAINFTWNDVPMSVMHIPAVDSNRLVIQSDIMTASAPDTVDALCLLMKINHAISQDLPVCIGIDEQGSTKLSLAMPVEHLNDESLEHPLDCVEQLITRLQEGSDCIDNDELRQIIDKQYFPVGPHAEQDATEVLFESICMEIKSYRFIEQPQKDQVAGVEFDYGPVRVKLSHSSKVPSNLFIQCNLGKVDRLESMALINLLKVNHVMSFTSGGVFGIGAHHEEVMYGWHQDIRSTNVRDLIDAIASVAKLAGSNLENIEVAVNPDILRMC